MVARQWTCVQMPNASVPPEYTKSRGRVVWQVVGLKPLLGSKSLILLVYLVPLAGIEPALLAESDFESCLWCLTDVHQLSCDIPTLVFPRG
jgi:hypothetical protein